MVYCIKLSQFKCLSNASNLSRRHEQSIEWIPSLWSLSSSQNFLLYIPEERIASKWLNLGHEHIQFSVHNKPQSTFSSVYLSTFSSVDLGMEQIQERKKYFIWS